MVYGRRRGVDAGWHEELPRLKFRFIHISREVTSSEDVVRPSFLIL